jgi:spore maturation protein A
MLFISPTEVLGSMITACEGSFRLCFDLLVIYSIWLGILQIAEDSGLSYKLAHWLSPATKKLFGNLDKETNKYLCMNISTNMLGMGGISTPMGIETMTRLQDGSDKATPNMKLFMVLACSSLQILPTTVIGLRIAQKSIAPADIFLPTLITTLFTTIIGVMISCAINKRNKK